MEIDWETFFSSAVDSQSDTDGSSSSSFTSSGSSTKNSISDGISRRTRSRIPRPPQELSSLSNASYEDLMKLELPQLVAAGKTVYTFLKDVIRSGQFHTWNGYSSWFGLGKRLSKAVNAKREALAPKRWGGEEIDVQALTGLKYPKGSWVAMSAEEYEKWDQSQRGVADQEYITGLYKAAEPPVLFDWTSIADRDSEKAATPESRYREYLQDIDRTNKFAHSCQSPWISDADSEEADLSRYREYRG